MITLLNRTVACVLGLSILACGLAMGAEPGVENLVAQLGSEDEQIRIRAIDELGLLGPAAAPAVPALTTLLGDDSVMVRAHAAGALGQIGEPAQPAAPDLVRSIADPEPAVRRKAVEALGRIRPDPDVALPAFIRLMEDADPGVRLRAIDALAEHGEAAVPALVELLETDRAAYWACLVLNAIGPEAEGAVPALAERVSDPRPEVRREAILALAEIGEAAAPVVDAIAAALDNETDRIAATYALGRLGRIPPAAESQIRENSHSSDPLLRTVSTWTLARIYPEDERLQITAARRLVASLKAEEPEVRATAAKALAALEPDPKLLGPMLEAALRGADEETTRDALDAVAGLGPAMVPQLVGALRFESLRPRVAFLLGEMGPDAEPAVEALTELMDDSNRRTQHEALMALAKIGPAASPAVAALVETLRQCNERCQYGAAYALGRIGPEAEAAKPALLQAARSDDDTLALLSAWALAQIAPECTECAEQTVPVLIAGLEHPNAEHRREAAAALGLLGPLAQPAIPALKEAARDADEGVRAAATAALEAVR